MSRYQTSGEALAALEKRIAGLDWQNNEADRLKMREAIRDVVNNTSVAAEGKVTVLYSGEVNGVDSFKIADELKNDPNVRILDKTEAFVLLSDKKFRDIQARAFGYEDYGIMNDALKERAGGDANKYYGSPEKVFEGDGQYGLWASISRRFAAETKGHVMIVTVDPRTNSVLVLTELPQTLSEHSAVTTLDGEEIDTVRNATEPIKFAVTNAARAVMAANLSTDKDSITRWLNKNPAFQTIATASDRNELKEFFSRVISSHGKSFINENVDNPYRVERHKVDNFLQRFANKKINEHHSLTESIRESVMAITSHPTVADAIDTIRNNSNPNLPVQVRARQLANESIDKLLQDGGALSRHARQLRTDIEALTTVQESMGRMNGYQKAMLSQSASLRNDAEILAGISSKTSGIDAFENRANPIKIDDKLAVNARAMSTSTNSGPAPLSGSHSRMS